VNIPEAYALQVPDGLRLEVLPLGAAVHRLLVPTVSGQRNVILGYPTLQEYAAGTTFFGATIGRYANRVKGGRFTLDGTRHQLDTNENGNTLHGGSGGFDTLEWTVESRTEASLTMSLVSPDGDQGFPGKVTAMATYMVTADEVHIHLAATTDRPTPLNLTNHSYVNLDGEGSGTVDDHLLTVHADHFTPTDELLIPTGEIAPVDGTPLDLRTPTRVGDAVRRPHAALRAAKGIDHNLVVRGDGLREIAVVSTRDLTLTVSSDAPGVQVYTGNFLDGTDRGTGGSTYRQGDGLALEPQAFPDTPNQPAFGSAVLRPGERYERRIIWRFTPL
jgi:aldose 1-epimerase